VLVLVLVEGACAGGGGGRGREEEGGAAGARVRPSGRVMPAGLVDADAEVEGGTTATGRNGAVDATGGLGPSSCAALAFPACACACDCALAGLNGTCCTLTLVAVVVAAGAAASTGRDSRALMASESPCERSIESASDWARRGWCRSRRPRRMAGTWGRAGAHGGLAAARAGRGRRRRERDAHPARCAALGACAPPTAARTRPPRRRCRGPRRRRTRARRAGARTASRAAAAPCRTRRASPAHVSRSCQLGSCAHGGERERQKDAPGRASTGR